MRTLFFALALAALVPAQYPVYANALQWTGTSQAGNFCWGFSCTPASATLVPGETGSLFIRAEWMQPYVLAFAPTATSCVPVPGFFNQLVLDNPITVFATGVCATGSPILSCPGGTATLSITIPTSWPPGLSFAIQGATGVSPFGGGNTWSFTQPIRFTVL